MSLSQKPSLIDAITKKPVVTGGVLALGNFDGVHRGHSAVIKAAALEGKRLKMPVHALTFEPHPYSFFQKDHDPFLLTTPEDKRRLLIEAGADDVVTLPFSPAFAALTPEQFIDDILLGACQVAHVVVGFDFVFGCRRGGDRRALREKLGPRSIGVTEVAPERDESGEIISSSRVRAALRKGDTEIATRLLGRPFTLHGTIEKGAQRGRTLNFPTANIALDPAIVRPLHGVYAVTARRTGNPVTFSGVANFGLRPTFDGASELLEFHLFDFEGSLYGDQWEIALHHFIRPEETFANKDALIEQIKGDAQTARDWLAQRKS